MIQTTIKNATIDIVQSNELKRIYIHAKLEDQTTMPKKSGRMTQHLSDKSYSWATLNYDLGNGVVLFLK